MKFSDVLRYRRLSLGMTQSDVAKKAPLVQELFKSMNRVKYTHM